MKTYTSFIAASIIMMSLSVQADEKESSSKHNSENAKDQFSFALIGDVPYGVAAGEHYQPYENLANELNEDNHVKWVLHAGDIKSGGTECSDELFEDRLYRFNKIDKPVVLTPGDNEWTDCHRVNAGEYQPLERLEKLRKVFYPAPGITLGGKTMQVTTQASNPQFIEFPENVMWEKNNVLFSAIHIVGSNNGLKAFDKNSSVIRTAADDEEVSRRETAALAWLEETFSRATRNNSPGIFIMIHANPGLEKTTANRYGFEPFLNTLENHTRAYGKPVVLAHGDSHYFRVDKPSINGYLKNLTRVETFGSKNVHWIKVKVKPESDNVFNFQQQIISKNN